MAQGGSLQVFAYVQHTMLACESTNGLDGWVVCPLPPRSATKHNYVEWAVGPSAAG
jgi:hypothetical protein